MTLADAPGYTRRMRKPTNKRLQVNPDTIRQLSGVELSRAAGGLPTQAISAENAGCCSFDICPPPPTEGCPSRGTSCRLC